MFFHEECYKATSELRTGLLLACVDKLSPVDLVCDRSARKKLN